MKSNLLTRLALLSILAITAQIGTNAAHASNNIPIRTVAQKLVMNADQLNYKEKQNAYSVIFNTLSNNGKRTDISIEEVNQNLHDKSSLIYKVLKKDELISASGENNISEGG